VRKVIFYSFIFLLNLNAFIHFHFFNWWQDVILRHQLEVLSKWLGKFLELLLVQLFAVNEWLQFIVFALNHLNHRLIEEVFGLVCSWLLVA